MKKINLAFLLLVSLFLSSCAEDDITVTINESGSLEIKLVDDEKKPLNGVELSLKEMSSGSVIYSETLDDSGVLKIDKVLQGSYLCSVRVMREGKEYTTFSYFQIIAKDHKQIEINPFSNSGKLSVNVTAQGTVRDFTKYTAILLPYDQSYGVSYEQAKAYAYYIGNLDADGKIDFAAVPANKNYSLLIYNTNKDLCGSANLAKTKVEQTIPIVISVCQLNVSIEGIIEDYSKYDVLVTKYLSGNEGIENIKASALYSGKADTQGKISFFEMNAGENYNAYLIRDNKIYYRSDFYSSSSGIKEISLSVGSITLQVNGSFPMGKENYSVGIVRGSSSSINSLGDLMAKAFTMGQLNASGIVKFTELPLFNLYQSSCYTYLYKGDKLYTNYDYFSWYDINKDASVYLYAND